MNDKPLFPDGPDKTAEKLFNRPLSEQPPKRRYNYPMDAHPTDPEDKVIQTVVKFAVAGVLIWAVYILAILSIIGTIGYVAWHFISKLW